MNLSIYDNISSRMNLSKQEVVKKLPIIDNKMMEVLEFSFLEKVNEEGDWIKISPNALKHLKPIVHPMWESAYELNNFKEVSKDANSGVTFAFYWKDGFLCWER